MFEESYVILHFQVIQVITENSSTFKDKTVYSQEKYVNKKQKKYGEVITIHKPTIRLLNDMYYTQDPLKIAWVLKVSVTFDV